MSSLLSAFFLWAAGQRFVNVNRFASMLKRAPARRRTGSPEIEQTSLIQDTVMRCNGENRCDVGSNTDGHKRRRCGDRYACDDEHQHQTRMPIDFRRERTRYLFQRSQAILGITDSIGSDGDVSERERRVARFGEPDQTRHMVRPTMNKPLSKYRNDLRRPRLTSGHDATENSRRCLSTKRSCGRSCISTLGFADSEFDFAAGDRKVVSPW